MWRLGSGTLNTSLADGRDTHLTPGLMVRDQIVHLTFICRGRLFAP